MKIPYKKGQGVGRLWRSTFGFSHIKMDDGVDHGEFTDPTMEAVQNLERTSTEKTANNKDTADNQELGGKILLIVKEGEDDVEVNGKEEHKDTEVTNQDMGVMNSKDGEVADAAASSCKRELNYEGLPEGYKAENEVRTSQEGGEETDKKEVSSQKEKTAALPMISITGVSGDNSSIEVQAPSSDGKCTDQTFPSLEIEIDNAAMIPTAAAAGTVAKTQPNKTPQKQLSMEEDEKWTTPNYFGGLPQPASPYSGAGSPNSLVRQWLDGIDPPKDQPPPTPLKNDVVIDLNTMTPTDSQEAPHPPQGAPLPPVPGSSDPAPRPKDLSLPPPLSSLSSFRASLPERQHQRETIRDLSQDLDCDYKYAVSKDWFMQWQHYVKLLELPTRALAPGPVEMDAENTENNDYVPEKVWKKLIGWYGISETHELDRQILYYPMYMNQPEFQDSKNFEICVLSPYAELIQHRKKLIDTKEEVGYIEHQLGKIFRIPKHCKTRLWVSKNYKPYKFEMLPKRRRDLCLHFPFEVKEGYTLAIEVCHNHEMWPTGIPGDPDGDLGAYNDVTKGQLGGDTWEKEITSALDSLSNAVTSSVKGVTQNFLTTTTTINRKKERKLEDMKRVLDYKKEKNEGFKKSLDDREKNMSNEELDLHKKVDMYKDDLKTLHEDQERFERHMKYMESLHVIQDSRVKLDVGGHTFTTSKLTLTKDPDSMLAAMFGGRHSVRQEEDGSYFIDRDGTYFRYILNYLRDGGFKEGVLPVDSPEVLGEILNEAEYYQIQSLVELIMEALYPEEEEEEGEKEKGKEEENIEHTNQISEANDNENNPEENQEEGAE